jgi:polysaccharide export outer membrane protein
MKTKGMAIIFALLVLAVSTASAAEYQIGPEDVLEISFWQEPTLNTQVRVSQDGTITLDIIGQINAVGKTTKELENEIVRQISRLNKRISQTVVRVVGYNFQYVFVSGQVNEPGKKTFEAIPDLWTILNEAGGITEFGDLSRVTIIRGGDRAGQVEIVNVAAAIGSGQADRLPRIGRQDTIEVPRMPSGIPSGDLTQQVERKNVIYAIGAVNAPGVITFEENVDIMEVLAKCGGVMDGADLSRIKVVTKDGYYAQTLEFDLDKYSETGALTRYVLRREDALVVPYARRGGIFGIEWGTLATIAGVATSVLLIYDQVASGDATR